MTEKEPDLAIKKHWVNAFPTPIVTYPWPDSEALNADLRALIVDREARPDGGAARGHPGGWHSELDFFTWERPAVETLHDRVRRTAVEITRKDRKSTRLNSSHIPLSRMPSSA